MLWHLCELALTGATRLPRLDLEPDFRDLLAFHILNHELDILEPNAVASCRRSVKVAAHEIGAEVPGPLAR